MKVFATRSACSLFEQILQHRVILIGRMFIARTVINQLRSSRHHHLSFSLSFFLLGVCENTQAIDPLLATAIFSTVIIVRCGHICQAGRFVDST